MFHWIRKTPRLLDTSLLHVDTTVSQMVYVHRPCAIVFCSKRKKTFFFKNCLVFFVPRLTIFILFSNSLHVATCKKFKVAENILIIFSLFKLEHIFHRAKSIEKNEQRYIFRKPFRWTSWPQIMQYTVTC